MSAAFFDVLGSRPVAGPRFPAGGERAGPEQGGRPRGRALAPALRRRPGHRRADRPARPRAARGRRHRASGVLPSPKAAELWTPMEYDAVFRSLSRGAWYLTVIGRLKPGVTVESARLEEWPPSPSGWPGSTRTTTRAWAAPCARCTRPWSGHSRTGAARPARRGRAGAADRVRQRGQPAPGADGGARDGAGRARRARRGPPRGWCASS